MAIQLQTVAVQYNQIPKESALLKDIQPLQKGDSITFRIKGSFDPSNPKRRVLRSMFLPNTDVVKDPETGETYDIAYIKGIGPGNVPILGDIYFDDRHGAALTLKGSRPDDVRKYQYIMLTNYLADNPNADPKKHKIEIESEDKDQEYVRTKRKKIQAALNAVEGMSDDEVLNFIRANRLHDPGTPKKRRFKLEDFAEKNPDAFSSAPLLDYTSLYDTIDALKKKKIIVWNNATRAVLTFDGSEILSLDKSWKFGMSWKEELAKHLIQPENKSQLKKLEQELTK